MRCHHGLLVLLKILKEAVVIHIEVLSSPGEIEENHGKPQ
jgi:hypothetical protein